MSGYCCRSNDKQQYCVCVCKGDKKAEADVDERLLIPFRHFLRWNIDEHSSSSSKHDLHYHTVIVDGKQVLCIMTIIKLVIDAVSCCLLGFVNTVVQRAAAIFLGVTAPNNLKMDVHVKYVLSQCAQRMYVLKLLQHLGCHWISSMLLLTLSLCHL